jgi:hypothetical protein
VSIGIARTTTFELLPVCGSREGEDLPLGCDQPRLSTFRKVTMSRTGCRLSLAKNAEVSMSWIPSKLWEDSLVQVHSHPRHRIHRRSLCPNAFRLRPDTLSLANKYDLAPFQLKWGFKNIGHTV